MNKTYTWISAIVMAIMLLMIIGRESTIDKLQRVDVLNQRIALVQELKIKLLEEMLIKTSPDFAKFKQEEDAKDSFTKEIEKKIKR